MEGVLWQTDTSFNRRYFDRQNSCMCHIQTLRYNFLVSKSDADISQWFPLIFRVFIGRFGWNIYKSIIKIVWLYVGHALKSPLLMQSDPDLGGWSVWVIVLIPIKISSTFVWGNNVDTTHQITSWHDFKIVTEAKSKESQGNPLTERRAQRGT